jgi:hypothetical protein
MAACLRQVTKHLRAIVPVYYWMVRNIGESQLSKVREFLVRFEEDRKSNLRLVNEVPESKDIDPELVESTNRSTNDQRSHDERFRILMKRFWTSLTRSRNELVSSAFLRPADITLTLKNFLTIQSSGGRAKRHTEECAIT